MVRAQNRRNIYIIIAIITLILIGIGYAFLTGDLNILGSARINAVEGKVHFENIQVSPGSVEADTPVITNYTTVTYTADLNTIREYYEFTVDIKNDGIIDAMIDDIEIDELTTEQEKYLDYSIAYSSGAALEEKQELKAGEKETLKIRVYYKADITASDLPTEDQALTFSVSIDYVQADNTAVVITHPVCRRATKLHTETCKTKFSPDNTFASYCCGAAGYDVGDTIKYGSLGTKGTLSSGDAFDCDVNGDGEYNSTSERFYYVTELDTNNNYGVLVYYDGVTNGSPSASEGYYYTDTETPRLSGPSTLLQHLPTTSQWKNVSLYNTTRKIKDELGNEYSNFSYEGHAARLLTTQEVETSCNVTVTSSSPNGQLDGCKYLLENAGFDEIKYGDGDWWLETVNSNYEYMGWIVSGYTQHVYSQYTYHKSIDLFYETSPYWVRPVIEVPKNKISY